MSSYKDRLKQARRPERSVPICLRGDLVAEWEAADREIQRLQKEHNDSKEGSGLGDLVERVRALEAEMLEHTDDFVLRAMPKYQFRALVAAHPPRKDDEGNIVDEDRQIGLNKESFFPELIRASVVSPELDDEDWLELLGDEEQEIEGTLTDRQFGDLEDAAWFLNRGQVDVPFSHAASLASRSTGGE